VGWATKWAPSCSFQFPVLHPETELPQGSFNAPHLGLEGLSAVVQGGFFGGEKAPLEPEKLDVIFTMKAC